MPITEELNNIKTLESAGFDHKQAEALAGIIEKAQVSGREDLKEFIRSENNNIRAEINNLRNELKQDIKDLEVRMAHAQRDLLVRIFGIVVGTVGIAVTILKLFP